jgi:hypothetical protein
MACACFGPAANSGQLCVRMLHVTLKGDVQAEDLYPNRRQ